MSLAVTYWYLLLLYGPHCTLMSLYELYRRMFSVDDGVCQLLGIAPKFIAGQLEPNSSDASQSKWGQ